MINEYPRGRPPGIRTKQTVWYGQLKAAKLEIRAATMRFRATEENKRRRNMEFSDHQKTNIIRDLLQLQARRVLRVWCDGGRLRVSAFELTLDESHAISWARGKEIAASGTLR